VGLRSLLISRTIQRMNRPKGLTLTAILMALCNAMLWTINTYTGFPHPLRLLAVLTFAICIGYIFIWFYWKGKDWARIAVLIASGLNVLNLRAWNTFSRIGGHHGFLAAPGHIMLAAKAVLSVALLYWLNTRPVVEFFKRDKVHRDLNVLLNEVLPFAKLMVSKYGEVFPFGATMSWTGEIAKTFNARIEGNHQPPSQPIIEVMTKAFQDQAAKRQLRAAAICNNVRTVPPGETRESDAVCCALEHFSGESVNVFIPYAKTSDGDMQYRESFSTKRATVFFAARLA
jgi:hypothetical protein